MQDGMELDLHVDCIEAGNDVRYCPLSGWYYAGTERTVAKSSAVQKLPAAEKWTALRDDLATAATRSGALKEGPVGLALVQHLAERFAGLIRA